MSEEAKGAVGMDQDQPAGAGAGGGAAEAGASAASAAAAGGAGTYVWGEKRGGHGVVDGGVGSIKGVDRGM